MHRLRTICLSCALLLPLAANAAEDARAETAHERRDTRAEHRSERADTAHERRDTRAEHRQDRAADRLDRRSGRAQERHPR
ncbi:MAG TPA: hypothetical protein DCY89_00650 [Gammaproteobacteria bacterium]|nr:hypothetical protein [Gammaproteobacteria bacterium]